MIRINKLKITLSSMFAQNNSVTKKVASIAYEEIRIIKDFKTFNPDSNTQNLTPQTKKH